ncbi:hypothetical protein LVJ82_05735 [Vitreoscilla massiliensis]|uniref:Uncharacterized protein n=1 Tax=Vitreoscilla massiliensis TaxID=1689272 RepID=A0ABY4E3X2_9NEIS|nr:hypothetical protein [Vitreoscilla massiliensis]UOO90474.1 hypothetical protein LVJ82_05735 [Vitreoscilla massiliensis]
MKTSILFGSVLLGSMALAQADNIPSDSNARIQEERTVVRQVTTQTGDMPAQMTTTSQSTAREVSIDPAPNFTIDGQPAYEIKEVITTTPVQVDTQTITE